MNLYTSLLLLLAFSLLIFIVIYIEVSGKDFTHNKLLDNVMKFNINKSLQHPLNDNLNSNSKNNIQIDESKSKHNNGANIHIVLRDLFNIGLVDPMKLYKLLNSDTYAYLTSLSYCPSAADRIDYPRISNYNNLDAFKYNESGSFIFYQHLRKAGGTGFCDLAKSNLGAKHIPPYYCMPDNVSLLTLITRHIYKNTIHIYTMHVSRYDIRYILCVLFIERIAVYAALGPA